MPAIILMLRIILYSLICIMLDERGIGEIRLGKKITDLKDVVPFRDFAQAGDYIVSPKASSFYYFTGDILKATDSIELLLAIEHIFIGVDSNGLINIIIVHFFSKQEQDVPAVLTKYYGQPSSQSDIQVEGMSLRQHIFWNTADREVQIGYSSATAGHDSTYPMMVITRTRELSLLREYTVIKRTWQL